MNSEFRCLFWFGAACASAAGAKKPITVHDLATERTTECTGPIWRPDGKAFAYQDKGKILLYDIDSLKATEWFDIDALEKNKKLSRPQTGALFVAKPACEYKRNAVVFRLSAIWSR